VEFDKKRENSGLLACATGGVEESIEEHRGRRGARYREAGKGDGPQGKPTTFSGTTQKKRNTRERLLRDVSGQGSRKRGTAEKLGQNEGETR